MGMGKAQRQTVPHRSNMVPMVMRAREPCMIRRLVICGTHSGLAGNMLSACAAAISNLMKGTRERPKEMTDDLLLKSVQAGKRSYGGEGQLPS